jgi:hypothetical protein
MLMNPINNIKKLKKRQNKIKNFMDDNIKYNNIQLILNNLKSTEKNILWFWEDITDDIQSLYDMIYLNIPFIKNQINSNEIILNIFNIYKIYIGPFLTIFTPIITILIPYIILLFFGYHIQFKKFMGIIYNYSSIFSSLTNIIPKKYITGTKYFTYFMTSIYIFIYLRAGYMDLRSSYDTNKIINILHKKINKIAFFVKNVYELRKITNIINCNDIDENLHYLYNLFKGDIFQIEPKLLTNKGKILSCYYKFLENKDKMISLFIYVGKIDKYLSIIKLYQENKKNNNKYSFVKYVDYDYPYINIKKLWHPNLFNKAITNDIIIGKNNNNKNLLITGPNKSGKSIFIKSLALSILFSQTMGITCSSKFISTPFTILNSYLHIPDNVGYESLFEAEMYRAKDHIDILKNLKKKEFAFIIMDEIFTSTNFIEGYSAAYAITKKLSNIENSISVITTHFTELYQLEEITNKKILNYRFNIKYDNNKIIIYPHKIERGFSKQYIALELLKKNNFDDDIIKDALNICKILKN